MEKLVELKNINKVYANKNVLNNISLTINKNQILAILGGNGTGKSTLLRIISGIERPSSGEINYPNKNIKIGYVPERFSKNIRFTPSEYLYYIGMMSGSAKDYLTKRIDDLLLLFELDKMKNHRIMELSKGNIQKVGLIQAILNRPNLLILDEPLSGLDSEAQEELVKILVELKQQGTTILLTYHESNIFESIVEDTFYLHDGSISETASSEKESIKLLIVRNVNKSIFKEWDGIFHVEEKGNQLYLYVTVKSSDVILSRVLQLEGSIEAVSTVTLDDMERML
ncbi:ATP-binding cassette domain-containing protein [Oceanobacillus chungangensis]|uniref:ABC transporter ATP-binding protein n=1 Tax=Oceanobacillus chungangensis TaxID=1229152 RepID=A0A3D8PQH3_9BACI|nr:ABC transporter ATP-binding protein [Oceanobacillus chungangensis]RDW17285.1 ABC transporter ATP-binding protein [Oceanobacillus chungangensis]